MTRKFPKAKYTAALLLTAASLAVPASAAAYQQPGGFSSGSSASAPAAQSTGSSDFSWSDAGVGAGAIAGLFVLGGSAVALRRRDHASTRPV